MTEPAHDAAASPGARTDAVDAVLERAVTDILSAVAASGSGTGRPGSAADPAPVVLIDGRSGAGKSTLARRLVAAWPGDVQLVALDELYPGWSGLDAGVRTVVEDVLEPYAACGIGRYQVWDWEAGRPERTRAVDPTLPLIVEGSGILTPRSARAAAVTVWVDAATDVRRERAFARDGDGFRPWWDMWAAQEDVHVRRDDPESLATVRVEVP